jgi:hypothetical protein
MLFETTALCREPEKPRNKAKFSFFLLSSTTLGLKWINKKTSNESHNERARGRSEE